MHRLLLRSFQSPGDILMLTAAVRDLHRACPGRFHTDVRSAAADLWLHNPFLTPLRDNDPGVRVLDMHYPLIHHSNQRPYHFIHGYAQFLEDQLGVRIPLTEFHGDIHLAPDEQELPAHLAAAGVPERFWIVIAGGKYDFTAKWWNPASYQQVVDHFGVGERRVGERRGVSPTCRDADARDGERRGVSPTCLDANADATTSGLRPDARQPIHFVQCGEQGHWHPPLQGVVNLVGRTNLRDFIRLMHHADGVLCPVTFAMHLAAAVPTRPGRPPRRPCVVVAGGREPPHWEAYPHHQFISTVGALPCCADGGCWKGRCQLALDGDDKDRRNLCERPVQITADLRIPQCLDMITPADVIRRIEMYATFTGNGFMAERDTIRVDTGLRPGFSRSEKPTLIEFRHGLGDAVQLTMVLRHLRELRPELHIDVAALVGKHSAFHGLCDNVLILDQDLIDRARYAQVLSLDWHECRAGYGDSPSTKPARCLREVFQITPRPELSRYSIHVSEETRAKAREYVAGIGADTWRASRRKPDVVLIHYQGNTSGERKDLPHEVIRDCCDVILKAGFVPVILDWDKRSPLPDGARIHNPGADHPLWGGRGTGDAETLAALIDQAALMIGIDSGPLHVAAATPTPTLAVWTQHHPVHYFDLADNVLHLVPGDHEKRIAGPEARRFFHERYRHQTYKEIFVDLPAHVQSALTGANFDDLANQRFLGRLTATGYGQRYYLEHKHAGLDYLNFGDWQQRYGRWLVEALALKGKKVLDVGCACGAILRGLGEAGAVVQGVEINEHMVRLGREKWPDMAPLLHVCDAVNLHLFADASWDAIHSAQVAEHWKPELVPFILRELGRVVVPGGLFFCCLDTEELFARQGRTMEHEDPTHVCIRPMSWWRDQLAGSGWQMCSDEFAPNLRDHAHSFLKLYDWDWFIGRNMAA